MELSTFEVVLRISLAVGSAAVIGLERELSVQPAGLRTHVLVSLGACTFTMAGLAIGGADPTRLAAQVATGVGFLGAGVILRDQFHVKGLTTAASLWVAASLGVAAGLGAYVIGAVATGFALLALVLARPVGNRITRGRHRQELAIDLGSAVSVDEVRVKVQQVVGAFDVEIVQPSLAPSAGGLGVQLIGEVRLPDNSDVVVVAETLRAIDGVLAVRLNR